MIFSFNLISRFGEFSKWVTEVERLSKDLQDESLTGEEYKTALSQFQVDPFV